MTRYSCYRHLPTTFARLRAEGPAQPLKFEVLYTAPGTGCWLCKVGNTKAQFTVIAEYPKGDTGAEKDALNLLLSVNRRLSDVEVRTALGTRLGPHPEREGE